MQVISHSSVENFILNLDKAVGKKVYKIISRLEFYGSDLAMPDAKPVGSGLWELRIRGHPAIRILYGFCEGNPVLLVAFKKQSNAIKSQQFALAQERLKIFCAK
jgi:phage-related protein